MASSKGKVAVLAEYSLKKAENRSEGHLQLQQELQDRLWREERHAYRQPPVDMPKEAIKAWRRATLLTWVVMWGWWR